MKKIILIFFAQIFLFCNVNAQSKTLTIGVVVPEVTNRLTETQVQKLTSKLTQIVNSSNEVTVGYTNDIVIYPIATIDETSVVEGGLQNITIITIELALFVKQVSTNTIFNSISKKLKGSGSGESQAITNAFSQIKTEDELYKKFIADSKTKILKYYGDNCSAIIQTANNLSAKQNYEQAISLLQSIPEAAFCYSDAQMKSIEVYQKYQTELCSKNITKAKASIVINNYEDALNALEIIDPASSCYPEVRKLIAQMQSKIQQKEQHEIDLEKQRINAVKEIAKAYYSRTVKLVQYNVLVR